MLAAQKAYTHVRQYVAGKVNMLAKGVEQLAKAAKVLPTVSLLCIHPIVFQSIGVHWKCVDDDGD